MIHLESFDSLNNGSMPHKNENIASTSKLKFHINSIRSRIFKEEMEGRENEDTQAF